MRCACGCGQRASKGRRYITGHNLRHLKRTDAHREAIASAQRRAWATKRKRLPIGSTWKDSDGYIRVKVVAGKGRWRPQHVLVMEGMIGRKLKRGEIVHHVNGVRDDNRDTNLFLCVNHAHHMRVERSLVETFRRLLDAGLARFNAEAGLYEAVLR